MRSDSSRMNVPGFLTMIGDPEARPLALKAITVIGRDPASTHILIADPRCSRNHAHIVWNPDLGVYRITDLTSKAGTFVNDEKIADVVLKSGDVIRVGDVAWRFTVEIARPTVQKKSWFTPERRGYRYLQLALTLLLVGTLFAFPFDDGSILPYWGNTFSDLWSSLWARLTHRIERPQDPPKPVIVDRTPSVPFSQTTPATRDSQPSTPESPSPLSEYNTLSQKSFDDLSRNVLDALARGDIAAAEKTVEEFRTSPFYFHHLAAVQKLKGAIAEAKQLIEQAERQRLAEIERHWKEIEDRVKSLVAAEKFGEANDVLRECADPRAPSLAAAVDRAREEHLKALPTRRALFADLVLKLRPLRRKRDYTTATNVVKSLMNDAVYRGHRPMLEQEERRLRACAEIHREIMAAIARVPRNAPTKLELVNGTIMEGKWEEVRDGIVWLYAVKQEDIVLPSSGARPAEVTIESLATIAAISPSDTLAEMLLGDEDFSAAAEAIALADVDAANEFFTRWTMTRNALLNEDGERALADADRLSAAGKDAKAREILQAVLRKYPLASEGQPPILARVEKQIDEIESRRMIGTIPSRKFRVLYDKGHDDEKVALLKALKVVGGKEVVPHLLAAMTDAAARVRIEAIRALAVCGGKSETWPLVTALDDPVSEVGLAAVETLKKLAIDPAAIRERFAAGDARERRLAVIAAGALGEEKLLDVLRKGLADEHWETRKAAAIGLGRMADKGSGSALVSALKKEQEEPVHAAIAFALRSIKESSGVTALAEVLKTHPRHRFRDDLITAIGQIGGSNVGKVLKPYLRDMSPLSPWTRYYAAEGLAESRTKITVDECKGLLLDEMWLLRAVAVKMLAAAGDDKALESVVLALDDQEACVRATAHYGLLLWPTAKVVDALIARIDDLGGEGKGLAIDILKRLTGQSLPDKKSWESWWRQNRGAVRLPSTEERLKPIGGKKQ